MWGKRFTQSKEGKHSKPGKWIEWHQFGEMLRAPLAGANLEA